MRVSEIFFSLQGEGIYIGAPTVFVRLYGCDLRCEWCDTMYAVEGGEFRTMSVSEVVERVEGLRCKTVCITGGEPLLQEEEVTELAAILLKGGYHILLETSGHMEPPPVFFDDGCVISLDCKCPGSAMESSTDFGLFRKLGEKDQLKFVIKDEADYLYAKGVLREHPTKACVVFQPVGGTEMKWIADRVLRDKMRGVRVLPQLHKLIWGNKRGV